MEPNKIKPIKRIEPKEAIRDWDLNYNLGAAVQLIAQHGGRPNSLAKSDLLRARQYIDDELNGIKRDEINTFIAWANEVSEEYRR